MLTACDRWSIWNCLPVQYKLHPCCSLTALNALDFSGDLRSANKEAIMGVVLHYSIFFMLYMHSLRICFGCLDGKFFSSRLLVSVIFIAIFKNSEKYIISWKKIEKKIIVSQSDLKNWKQEQLQNFCSNILPTNMTFLRLTVNFSSLQLTDICKKVTSHAKSSAKLIFVVAKLFKARRTPRTVPFPDIKNQTISNEGRRRKKF